MDWFSKHYPSDYEMAFQGKPAADIPKEQSAIKLPATSQKTKGAENRLPRGTWDSEDIKHVIVNYIQSQDIRDGKLVKSQKEHLLKLLIAKFPHLNISYKALDSQINLRYSTFVVENKKR